MRAQKIILFLASLLMAANVFAVTIEDVLAPGFFNPEEWLYLTEESVVTEDPRGKLGKAWKKKYKDVVIVTTIGVDSGRDRHYKQVLKTVKNSVNGFVGSQFFWLKNEKYNLTANTTLTTPDDKQKQTGKMLRKRARVLYNEWALPTNTLFNANTASTRRAKRAGVKPLAPYAIEGSYKETIDEYGGEYYGMTHTATTNISGNVATITGKIVEKGYLGEHNGFTFDTPAVSTISYTKKFTLNGNTLLVDQEMTSEQKDISTFNINIVVNYSAKLNSDGTSISEKEKFKRHSYEEYSQKCLDYWIW